MIDIWRRLAAIDKDWIEWEDVPGKPGVYSCRPKRTVPRTVLADMVKTGGDWFAMWAASRFISDGPKVFRPTLEQCHALEQIEVNLEVHDYCQPFPAMLVDFPSDYNVQPFDSVLCFQPGNILILCLNDLPTHEQEIVTTIQQDGRPIEVSLQRFDPDCAEQGPAAARATRVAVNACLALTNFGCRLDYLLPHDVERDRVYAKENNERGAKARQRLTEATHKITFNQEVVLHRTEGRGHEGGESTGQEKSPHWRRGHWAMQAFGKGRSERKRILRPPVLVRADRLGGDGPITTVYKT